MNGPPAQAKRHVAGVADGGCSKSRNGLGNDLWKFVMCCLPIQSVPDEADTDAIVGPEHVIVGGSEKASIIENESF